MTSAENSKTERLQLKIPKIMDEFFQIISSKNPKDEFCRAKLGEFFLKYGIYVVFTEFAETDLSNFKIVINSLRKTSNGHEFERLINKIKAERGSRT